MGDAGEGKVLAVTTPIRLPTDAEILAMLGSIRRAPGQEGAYAPHKPLMLLLALGRVQQRQPRLAAFTQVEAKMSELLTEFARTGAAKNRNMPFWRLKNDARHQLWQVQARGGDLSVSAVKEPTPTIMRETALEAGFTPEVFAALSARPDLVIRAASSILDANFPKTLHPDIAQAVGLDITPETPTARDSASGVNYGEASRSRRKRDPDFRDMVLRAYEYRCCICGFDLRVGHLPAGLEAAHIQWHTVGGPDEVPNGLSLCALHHKLFDLGAFTVTPGHLRIQFSQRAIAGDRSANGELRHHGHVLIAPQQPSMKPGDQFLEWNLRNVFKEPGRAL